MKKFKQILLEAFYGAWTLTLDIITYAILVSYILTWHLTFAILLSVAMPIQIIEREIFMFKRRVFYRNFSRQIMTSIIVWLLSAASLSIISLVIYTHILPYWTLALFIPFQFIVYIYYANMYSTFGGAYIPILRGGFEKHSTRYELLQFEEQRQQYFRERTMTY